MASVQQPLPPVLNSGQRRTGLTRLCFISGGVSQIPPSELTLPWQPHQTLVVYLEIPPLGWVS